MAEMCNSWSSSVARQRRMLLRRTRLRRSQSQALSLPPEEQSQSQSQPQPCTTTASKRQRLDPSSTTGTGTDADTSTSYNASKKKTADHSSLPASAYGVMSICGRRRQMEDAVSINNIQLSLWQTKTNYHFFGVFDGHGCSHVAELCKQRMHQIVAQQLHLHFQLQQSQKRDTDSMQHKGFSCFWRETMEKCFALMDKEVVVSPASDAKTTTLACSCALRLPCRNKVGSTATVALVTPSHVIVANCGDSRAVLCRNGSAFPLSSDHKPDRPDEMQRIRAAGGHVIYWDGARVSGVLAVSRAIGDGYLKPYVINEPEVTVTEITEQDECLILATDGLWDVVPNDLACQVVTRCLRAARETITSQHDKLEGDIHLDKACARAAMLLTKLALARHSTDNISVLVINLRSH